MTRLVPVAAAVLCLLGVGGCRGADRTALPAPRSTPVSQAGSVAAAGPARSAADPLAGIESSLEAVERDVDADSRPDAGAVPTVRR